MRNFFSDPFLHRSLHVCPARVSAALGHGSHLGGLGGGVCLPPHPPVPAEQPVPFLPWPCTRPRAGSCPEGLPPCRLNVALGRLQQVGEGAALSTAPAARGEAEGKRLGARRGAGAARRGVRLLFCWEPHHESVLRGCGWGGGVGALGTALGSGCCWLRCSWGCRELVPALQGTAGAGGSGWLAI